MKNFTTVLKIAPAFLLASAMVHAQTDSTTKEKKIDEVVLIGYGKQKKTDLTGSISSISSKDFNAGSSTADQLIVGRTPGVQITGNSGAPGAGSTIRVRGGSSFINNDPLIVIDGVPIDFNSLSGATNPLSLINPNDIETFDILKDASSAAIYGNRASNGVILITTKKGTSGKFKINFNTNFSVSTKMGNADVLDADQFRSFVNTYGTSAQKSYLGSANTNWQDLIYQQAWGTDNNVAFSGGLKGLPYRVSVGYNEQNGIVRTNEFRRTSLGLNFSPKFLDNHLTVNGNFKGTFSENRFPDGGAIGASIYFDPTQPVYSGNSNYGGYWEWLDPANTATGLNVNGTRNPLGLLYSKRDISSVFRIIPSLQLDYKFHFLPDLRLNVMGSYDYAKSDGSVNVSGNYAQGIGTLGSYRPYSQEIKSKLFESYLNYVKNIQAISTNVDIIGGYSYQDTRSLTPVAPTYYGNGQKTDFSTAGDTQRTLLSFYARGIFTIANRYVINASVRRDGSSTFWNGTDKNNLWGNFPAVSVAWKINEEGFLKNISSINSLKVRAGWGKTGQQETGTFYPAFGSYSYSNSSTAQYQFGNNFYTLLRPDVYNPNLVWETTTTKNIGLDFGILNNRINGSVDFFDKKSENLIAKVPTWAGDLSNFNVKNVGIIENKGFEANLNIIPVKNENMTWDINFNATKFNPKVSSLSQYVDSSYKIAAGGITGINNYIQAITVGQPLNAFYVYQQVYDNNGKPMDGVYVDRNNDGKINENDKYFYKSPTPDVILGFSTKVSYKKWEFGTSLRAVLGNYVYNNSASNSSIANIQANNFLSNTNTSVLTTQFATTQLFSDMFIEDASFLRMDNFTIGYNAGEFMGKGTNLRINAMAQNVFVITKYKGIDPEVFGGIDNGFYQRPKVYSFGFNFQF
ncbi:SusC/RagA family TonB-linked outer membrane protein [uncultured Chryseobacterium sp.]|uniref:SusC/RagA family TonB-linked outer membrane protein n=1 Tax=uncultured Chryseobacterium sp. TaxID=259322 RepID=UPI0025ED6BB9|nr:SusC/RagA family TonB-linked outer membrane protein [uncultured Chryseobacterium sp.]